MRKGLRLSHKALVLVSVPLIFEFLFVGILVVLLHHAEYETRKEAHRKAVVAESYKILNSFINSASLLYLYWLTQQPVFKQQYEDICNGIPIRLNSLKIMLRDSPEQAKPLDRILVLSNRTTVLMNQAMRLGRGKQYASNRDLQSEIEGITVELLSELRRFVKEQEKQDTFDPQQEDQSRLMIEICLSVGLAANVALALAMALFFNRGITKRLAVMTENTGHLAKGESLLKPLSGEDEIAHLDHTFHEMAQALDRASQYKQELISVVSHELRSPLTSVRATLTMLSLGHLGEMPSEAQEAITKAERNTVRLIKLINDLLDVERMEAGKIELRQSDIPLQVVLERSLDSILLLAANHDVDIDVAATDLHVYADEERLIQVVVNLLSNAVKFSPKDGVVTLCACEVGQEMELTVIDSGRGIPQEAQEKIFQRYEQVESSDNKKGTGLGLPICKAIIEAHGGTIGVRDNPDQGSIFWFRIPLAAKPDSG